MLFFPSLFQGSLEEVKEQSSETRLKGGVKRALWRGNRRALARGYFKASEWGRATAFHSTKDVRPTAPSCLVCLASLFL
jgi:MoaA/NifB/PqqE/SkfB family radical SAM enzyme